MTQRPLALALMALCAPSLLILAAPVAEPDPGSARKLATVEVVGDAAQQKAEPGSASLIDAEEIKSSRVFSVSEALRKVPGVVVRDEEGFGIRPNIGIRGQNPTRSTKVLLLEDGLPAAYAPYGDNASYYHAPVDRYARIEVLKGVGMLAFGPQTLSGVVNYITPEPPESLQGEVTLTAGNRSYANVHAAVGGGGFLFDVVRKQGDGSRDTLELEQTDFNLKYAVQLAPDHALTLRGTWLNEDSQVGYSGLTTAEYQNFGRDYGFDQNARFDINRYGGSATHRWTPTDDLELTTSAYGYTFERDWWRQSSNTTDTQCGTAFRDARLRGERVDFDACNSTQGRLRAYDTYGFEPRLRLQWSPFGVDSELTAGVRAHWETQERRQINGNRPDARTGTLAEDNRRETLGQSAFVAQRFNFGKLAVVPAVRVEHIEYDRLNRLNGRAGSESITEWIPGLGINYTVNDVHTVYAGAHKGFAPPRAEDLIDNNGGSVEVSAEDSRNLELGWRADLAPGQRLELTAFRNDFRNQVLVGSIAGGATPLAEGETLYEGMELSGYFSREDWIGAGRVYSQLALTWLPTAEQETAVRAVSNGAIVGGSAPGNRLPYAPKFATTLRLGYQSGAWDGSIEGVHVGRQFGDFANTRVADASGQFGELPGATYANFVLNYVPVEASWGAFLAVKNLFDRDAIVDRTRGIQVSPPRMIQVGVSWRFE